MRKSLVKLCEQCCVAVVSPEDSVMLKGAFGGREL